MNARTRDPRIVTPKLVEDSVVKNLRAMERQYIANLVVEISTETSRLRLLSLIDQHREYRDLWMQTAKSDARGFACCRVYVARARECNRLIVRAKRRLTEISDCCLSSTGRFLRLVADDSHPVDRHCGCGAILTDAWQERCDDCTAAQLAASTVSVAA